MSNTPQGHRTHDLSLRWKALIALSLALVVVNASLALISNTQLVGQFEAQQAEVRAQQDRQLRALIAERTQEMSKLASLVPLLGGAAAAFPNPDAQIEAALLTNGAMLDLEWDIRSIHWMPAEGNTQIAWPDDAKDIPQALRRELATAGERSIERLLCEDECLQYQTTPVLWEGAFAGTLVLGRSLADALLIFNALTDAQIAVAPADSARGSTEAAPQPGDSLHFPAVTYPETTLPILRAALALPSGIPEQPVRVQMGAGQWFEVSRIPALASGIDALVVNDVSAQRAAIQGATLGSIMLGTLGLILSGALLIVIVRGPLSRLSGLATVLPFLADNRYAELRRQLPSRPDRFGFRDEIDRMTESVSALTDRMETLQRDREQAEARLGWLADHDPLTHLFNRRRFKDDFERILDQATRFGHQGALLMLDLDQFKDVNELHGHLVGDILLERVAKELRAIFASSDLLARLGGDEFGVVLPETSQTEATASAEAIQHAVRQLEVEANGRRHQVSASIGIVMFPIPGSGIDQIMANADLAMYQAKERGRGGWYLFSESDEGLERLDARVLWREQIDRALDQDRFEIHIQPIVEIATGRESHFEVLLRMRDQQGVLIYPDRFIPVAEHTGQIRSIDRWVIDHALAALTTTPGLSLAVNLSGSAMDDVSLLSDIERLLDAYGVAAERISFEVTETAAISSLGNATRLMQGLQHLGCRFALDDFGSGYASYAYLRKLPVDDVKIDGAFIRDIATNREDRIFVKAITDMSHGMGKRVIAEFVEGPEILDILRELGVDAAQGYHFARPAKLEMALAHRAVDSGQDIARAR
jgi:diguanylate cyclase (GGDEF)-like protein